MPGYEAKFVNAVDKCFECPVCLTVLRDPVQVTPCGHRVCKTCIQPILRNKRPRCPLDNLPVCDDQVFSDNACHRQILSMDILCRHNEKGCTWTGPLNDHKKHLDNCDLNNVNCPKNCGASLERRKVDEHFTECDNRQTPCLHCKQMIVFSSMDVHLQSCASFPISCPLKCGVNELSKQTVGTRS
ncbi:TNF receptor-associated factor 4 [Exaiptasia diaphana]|nr:TNF receptor-associated factor 4 [Exaiptasia diaphana]